MKNIFILIVLIATSCGFSKNKKQTVATISTEYGDIKILLYDETPKHKENFVKLAKEGFYDSTTFHRIMPSFMIQGGDPNSKDDDPRNDGQGSPGYTIDGEFNRKFLHFKGALAAARMPDQVNPEKKSSGCQFYIVDGTKFNTQQLNGIAQQKGINYTAEEKKRYTTEGGYAPLDLDYTVYGMVISGMDVVGKIIIQPKDRANRPFTNIYMTVTVEEMKRKKIEKEFGYIFPEEE